MKRREESVRHGRKGSDALPTHVPTQLHSLLQAFPKSIAPSAFHTLLAAGDVGSSILRYSRLTVHGMVR